MTTSVIFKCKWIAIQSSNNISFYKKNINNIINRPFRKTYKGGNIYKYNNMSQTMNFSRLCSSLSFLLYIHDLVLAKEASARAKEAWKDPKASVKKLGRAIKKRWSKK